jgi:DNA polymerase III sliding clamp (beta) subunit (PCNA family)
MNPEHYPDRKQPPPKLDTYEIAEPLLREAIGRVKACMASEAYGRAQLNTILLTFSEKSLISVSTDGNSMAKFEHHDDFSHTEGSVMVTGPALGSVLAMAKETVQFSYTDSEGFVKSKDSRLSYQLPGATFPPWRTVLEGAVPDQDVCSFDVDQLRSAIAAVTSVSKGSLELTLSDSALKIALCGSPDAQSEDVLSVEARPETKMHVYCDPVKLIDLLNGAGGGIGKLRHDATAYNCPIIVLSDDGFLGLLQPFDAP